MDDRQKTTPAGALTPGLAALLDKACDDTPEAPADPDPDPDPMQLTLFDVNEAGDFVGWNGETL